MNNNFRRDFYAPSYCPYEQICVEGFSPSIDYWEGLLEKCPTKEEDAILQCMAGAAKWWSLGWGWIVLIAVVGLLALLGVGVLIWLGLPCFIWLVGQRKANSLSVN